MTYYNPDERLYYKAFNIVNDIFEDEDKKAEDKVNGNYFPKLKFERCLQ